MKLLIDIDEKDYANIKDCPTDYEYSVALMAIANGTPYEPKGEWIKCGWSIRCSICNYDMPYTVRNFCPNCGARMI